MKDNNERFRCSWIVPDGIEGRNSVTNSNKSRLTAQRLRKIGMAPGSNREFSTGLNQMSIDVTYAGYQSRSTSSKTRGLLLQSSSQCHSLYRSCNGVGDQVPSPLSSIHVPHDVRLLSIHPNIRPWSRNAGMTASEAVGRKRGGRWSLA